MPIAYLASGFGFTVSTQAYMRSQVVPALQHAGITVINPWDLTSDAEVADALASGDAERLASLRHTIGERNAAAIRQSDLVIANLDGQEVDSGVCWEMGFAYGLGRPVYAWRADFRASGELGGLVNLQVAYGVQGPIDASLEALIEHLRRDGVTQPMS